MTDLLANNLFPDNALSPLKEIAAYEALWARPGTTFKRIADRFRDNPSLMPSNLVSTSEIEDLQGWLLSSVLPKLPAELGVRISGTTDFPEKLMEAAHPLAILYFIGNWDLVYTKSVAVVGARKVTPEGKRRCAKIVQGLVGLDYTIVSGLAEGVDTIAHETCLSLGGRTFGVIGTPLTDSYPSINKDLQKRIAKDFLLVSQVPFKRYMQQDYRSNRAFFPERNVTMSALSDATVIIEASDTSGTLYQARAALKQDRKLFILNSCFERSDITWPAKFEEQGAIRVHSFEDIANNLKPPTSGKDRPNPDV